MRLGLLIVSLVAAMTVPSLPAAADGWGRYGNDRFGYAIDIPPGFSPVTEAENSDGGVSHSADDKAELRAWGAYLVVDDFAFEIAERIRSDASEGWSISYDRRTAAAASWSGIRNDRVFYARAMMGCDDAAIYFRLEYDRADLDAYDPVVRRLVKSLHARC